MSDSQGEWGPCPLLLLGCSGWGGAGAGKEQTSGGAPGRPGEEGPGPDSPGSGAEWAQSGGRAWGWASRFIAAIPLPLQRLLLMKFYGRWK